MTRTEGESCYVRHDLRGHELPSRYQSRWRLKATLIITASTMGIEFAGGFLSGSLALISDAWHMFTHAFALGISYVAIIIASRPYPKEKSFGFFRVEILAAFLNGIFLIGIIVVIFWYALDRILNPIDVNATQMFWIGLLGLGVNVVCAWILYDPTQKDLNMRGAFLHMLTDTLSSVGVVGAAIVIYVSGWTIIDPLISIVIGLLILRWAIGFLKSSFNILLEATPSQIRVDEVGEALKKEISLVHKVHDIHVWEITSGMYSMTAHLIVDDVKVSEGKNIIEQANRILSERFHIEHTNLQLESHEHD
jgi:cobalt-zinc-cadmium efflux system protein